MSVIESMVPAAEVYSIDEAFAELTGMPGDLERLGRQIRAEVYRWTGIPVGIGIASTKTLAKLANYAAKKWQSYTGGVVDLRDDVKRNWVLKKCDAGDVWGIGRRLSARLAAMDIRTAWELAHADAWSLRKQFSVVVEKTARELAGTTCLKLDEPDPPKNEICSSRMFATRLTELAPIKEAVATYTSRAAETLRGQQSLCKRLRVSIRTGMLVDVDCSDDAYSARSIRPQGDCCEAGRYCIGYGDRCPGRELFGWLDRVERCIPLCAATCCCRVALASLHSARDAE